LAFQNRFEPAGGDAERVQRRRDRFPVRSADHLTAVEVFGEFGKAQVTERLARGLEMRLLAVDEDTVQIEKNTTVVSAHASTPCTRSCRVQHTCFRAQRGGARKRGDGR
jgi:hypothetical protein